MKAKIHFSYALLFVSFVAFSQDVYFFNPSQALLSLNPSFAGSNGGLRYQGSYQHDGVSHYPSYNTFSNGVDGYIKPLKAGIAVSSIYDNGASGLLKTTGVSVTYAQHLGFFKNKLKIIPSIQIGYGQKKLSTKNLTFGDLLDPRMGIVWDDSQVSPSSRKHYINGSAGILVNYKNLYAGASVFNINQPDVGLLGYSKLPARFSANASYNIHAAPKTLINILGLYSKQGSGNLAQLNATAIFNHLVAGVGFVVQRYKKDYSPYANSNYIDYYYRGALHRYNAVLLSLGYRNSFMSLTGSYNIGVRTGGTGYSVALSVNLRNKDQKQLLTNLEAL